MMRDRRNTSLSLSSTSSSSRTSFGEKRSDSRPSSPTTTIPETRSRRRSMAIKALVLLTGIVVLLRCWHSILAPWNLMQNDRKTIQPGLDLMPTGSAALAVSDGLRRPRWTVAIPKNASFPLAATQCRNICASGEELRDKLMDEPRLSWSRSRRSRASYYANDWTFLDPADVETTTASNVCERSLTFVFDADEASLGKSLLMLWLSYGLAKQEGRAFFVDDIRWAYGNYTAFFPPLPDQGCAPPPPHHVLPCPHQARHLLVSAATAPWTFGPAFEKEFTQIRKHGSARQRPVYDLIRKGYEDLFGLIGEDAAYAKTRIARAKANAAGSAIIGMHIRRGDLHPHEYQFSRDYLPLERYADAARALSTSSPLFLLASDDPDTLASPELSPASAADGSCSLQRAQTRIVLATKHTLAQPPPLRAPGSAYVKHIDENSGWEGGFYRALFYANPSVRELVGRAFLLDLAVLGEADGVVCAVSSAACRVLGVMLGWQAVEEGRWVNVDDGRTWSWR